MASPFRYFRKHSKMFIAAAAIMCIFLFVFASGSGGGRSRDADMAADATVATWEDGSLNQRELASLVGQRVMVDDFLRRLFTQGGGRDAYDLPSTVPPLLLQSQENSQIESEVISTEVMADLAQRAGITVSDEMVNHYLEEFSLRNVKHEEILGILASVGPRDLKQNEAVIFSMLRKMLAAYFYRSSLVDASYVVLPEQRWEDWRDVNERISLQVAELPVESFEKDVPPPTDAKLQALYNDYKEADPTRWPIVDDAGTAMPPPTPAFAEPHRVRLEFLAGTIADRTGQFLDKVTEEQIADYYDRNKRREFVKTDFGSEDDEQPAPGADEQTEPASPPAAENPAPSDAQESPPPSTTNDAPANEASPAPADAPTTDEQPNEPSSGSAPAPSQPAAAEGAPAESGSPTTESSSNASSGVTRRSVFRLAAYQTAPADAPAPTEPAPTESTPSAAPAAETPPGDDAAPTAKEPPASSGEAQPSEDSAATPATEAEDQESPADAPTAEAKETKPAEEELLEFEPLEKVRDEIRETLAREMAVDDLEKIMSRATAELQGEYRRHGLAVAMAKEEKQPVPKPPAKLADLQWLADKYKLKYEKMAALTLRELFDTAVGKAADVQSSRTSAAGAAFSGLNPYEPFLAKELEGDYYLVVKTEDSPYRVPELSKIGDRVLAAYTRREAATLALNEAKKLAEVLPKSSQSFDAFFKDKGYEVIDPTELFSRLSFPLGPGTGQPPSLSEVPKLKNLGPEFMDAAFSLKENEAKAVRNFDHSKAYVIRLHSRQYPEDELKELFLADEGSSWPGRSEMRYLRYRKIENEVDREILENIAQFKLDEDWLKRRAERAAEN